MTTTARIAATQNAGTYTASIASGSTAVFGAYNLGPNEVITVKIKDSSGSYHDLYYLDESGAQVRAELRQYKNTIALTGPLDMRISKPATGAAVEVAEYS